METHDAPGTWAARLVALLPAAAVLTFDSAGWHPFGPAKWLLVTTIAFTAAAVAFYRGTTVHRPSLTFGLGFLAWAVITSLLAEDALSAWLGTPDRRFGVVAVATLLAAYAAGMGVATTDGRRWVARSAVVASLGSGAYGLLEWVGSVPVDLTTTTDRLGATFGSPAYLGAALCLLLPLSAGLALDPEEVKAWRVAAAVGSVSALLLLAGSGTRGAAIGLAVGLVALVARRWPTRRRVVPWLVAGALAAVVVAVSPLGGRLLETEGVEGRLAEWRVATRAVADQPLFGTGLEGYRIQFPTEVDIEYVRAYGRTTVTDRAHSGPLDLGVATGLPGMFTWLGAAAFLYMRAWRALATEGATLAGFATGIIAFWTQELFLFPTVEVSTIAWAVAGSLVMADSRRGVFVRSWTLGGLAALMALVAAVAGVLDVVADRRAAEARQRQDVEMAESAASLRPDDFRYRLLTADLLARRGEVGAALDQVEDIRRSHPGDPALRMAEARLLSRLPIGSGPRTTGADRLGQMVEADPLHPELRLLHGEMLAATGRAGEAERAFLAASELTPNDATPYVRLATLYLALGRTEEAESALDRAAATDPTHPDLEELRDRTGT